MKENHDPGVPRNRFPIVSRVGLVRRLIALIAASFLCFLRVSFGVEYPFTSVDVLSLDCTPGATAYDPSSDTYTVRANGHDIWNTEDDFRFLYMEMTGDFSVSVRVDNPAGLWPHSWSKAGLMVRQDLSPGSKDVYLVATRDNGVAFQWRDSPNLPASWTGTSEPTRSLLYPIWLRIVRSGNVFTGLYSEDGKSWVNPPQNRHACSMGDPVRVGICLTSHVSGVLATATFGDFHIPQLEASTVAIVSPDQTCREGDVVILDGTKSWNATVFLWEQVLLGDEPEVVILQPDHPVVPFIAPQLDVATILTFRLTTHGPAGADSAVTHATVRANNAPMVPPSNLLAELGNLSVTLRWDAVLDADAYVLKRAELLANGEKSSFQTIRPWVKDVTVTDEHLEEGVRYFYVVTAKNSFPPYEGPPSNEISLAAMANLALRPDTTPIALVTAPVGGGLKNVNAIMNGITRENYDTFDDYQTLDEDWFGYSWDKPLYFDHIVYYEGRHFYDGGWWTRLTVQFSEDGVTWKNAPNVAITPPYDCTDSPLGRRHYSRFDITFKPVRARSIRIYGCPGGIARFASVAELEVYGSQNRHPLMVYGVDQNVDERSTAVLDGTYSFSTRGPLTHYHWQQRGGSPTVILSDPQSPRTTFDAPDVDHDTLLTFILTAGDAIEEKSDEVLVLVRNLITRADAGPDITAFEDTLVQLDASASVTTSGQLAYEWTQLSGRNVVLSDAHSPRPAFTAPSVWDFFDRLTFQVRVDDGLGGLDSISTDAATVWVKSALSSMTHVEKSGYVVIEAENYSSTERNHDDRGVWQVVQGEPTYVEVPDIPGVGGTRTWEHAAEISYNVQIRRPGNYYVKLRRFVPDGAGHDGGKNNSCWLSIKGRDVIREFDNADNYNRWLWAPSQYVAFLELGNHTLQIRCREDGYRIDRIVLHQLTATGAPEDWSWDVGPLENRAETDIVCSRELGTHYTPGTAHPVSLRLDVNTPYIPNSLSVTEYFPSTFSVVDPAGGDASVPGHLAWTFSAPEVSNRTITYLLAAPSKTRAPAEFDGYLSYGETKNEKISGQRVLYPLPSPPAGVNVEMLVGATISWLPSPDDGVVAYHVYRSSDGENWAAISGPCRQTSFVDSTVQPGMAYIYRVTSENPAGAQSPLSLCQPTAPQAVPYMEVREAEDYDYGGGLFPGGPGAPPAVRASRKDDLIPGTYFYCQEESRSNSYRPDDPVDIQSGEGCSGWLMRYSTPGDWWRYTFDVPVAGYIKLAYRGSTNSSATANIRFFWDESLVGKITYNTLGGPSDWKYYSLEPFLSAPGPHVLRMELASGDAYYDLVALGYNWDLDGRKVIYGDDFGRYSKTTQAQSIGGWTIRSGSSSPGAWQLWSTLHDPLTAAPSEPGPDLPGMTGNYMVSNGDFAPEIALDEQLISPPIECADYDRVRVQFASHINIYEEDLDGDLQTTDFDVSIYDPESQSWSDWTSVFTHDYSDGDQASDSPLSFDISSLADGKRIRLRWHFHNTRYDFWWAIDNVFVTGRPVGKPKIVALEADGGNTLTLSWERFGSGYYTVQYTDDLSNPSWTDVEWAAWPIMAATWTGQLPPGQPMRFYRVISE